MTTGSFTEDDRREIGARLRKIEGQVRGIQKMVTDGRDCTEIVRQLTAARAALDRTGSVIVSSSLRGCLSEAGLEAATMVRLNGTLDALTALRS